MKNSILFLSLLLGVVSSFSRAECYEKVMDRCMSRCEYESAREREEYDNYGPTSSFNLGQEMLLEQMEESGDPRLIQQAEKQRRIRKIFDHGRRQLSHSFCRGKCRDEAEYTCY